MKKIYLSFLLILNIYTIQAQIVNIPDANFKNALLNNYPVIDTNGDGEIQTYEAEVINYLNVENKNISDLSGIEAFINLTNLQVRSNNLVNLDVSNNMQLFNLDCSYNQITNLTLGNNLNLKKIFCNNNMLSSIDLTSVINLEELTIYANSLTSLNVSNNSNLKDLTAYGNSLNSINLNGASAIEYLSVSDNQLSSLDLSSNVNLIEMNCNFNLLTAINFGNLSQLTYLNVSNNLLQNLNINNLIVLEDLYATNNQLNFLDVSGNNFLDRLFLNYNSFSDINSIINNTNSITLLNVSDNQIVSLDVTGNSSITKLYLNNNLLNDFTSNNTVEWLELKNNQFVSLDLSENNESLSRIVLSDNSNLSYINLKNSFNNNFFYIDSYNTYQNLSNLEAVCLDDINSSLAGWIQQQNSQSIIFTEYCSFTPGGDYYEVQGQVSIDLDNNGCDVGDEIYPNLNIQIDNGSEVDSFYSSDSGIYYMPIQSGNYTITPQLENPVYFSVNPISNIVNFPSDVSPSSQDYCITPNGNYNDLEVVIVPLEAARPGFDTDYKIVFKNKGTTTLSGILNLTYDDNHMDLVTVNPIADSQSTGVLSFNYNLLLPFETREITFTMNLNTPTDVSYPLLGDDVLNFLATITPVDSDETPLDNTFALDQIVVNSYDPNDKTCLEGETIDISRVGEFIHYLIRFENTGTANAVNIVVKDVIDASKYDISSLVPLDASHNFYTRIRNGNEVEFIFENIQLPYDDANNDGHVLFKIKTESSLVVGDTFTNQAEIYFDFNAPIVTNNEITTVVEDNLSVQSYDLINKVKVFPNPTNNNIFIEAIKGVEIYTIEVIDISGKELLRLKNVNNCNLLGLTSGIYFLKIQTNKGEVNKKIIKK
ncbi:DUF7619 domain-containing protein [Mesoflavibacter profundi]|uniref:DUF7619 domain-containing protein n=1 Tax=Mesoflavibacter profundi TaxID=2708110 RepID=UPI00168AD776|nr:T9SS type A sorting domain-containing protein [Mesoflavibacter profundi]